MATEIRKTDNLYFFNNAGSFIVFLVVLLHIALAYSGFTKKWWIVVSDESTIIADIICGAFDIFLMPILFFVSGFFTSSSYDRETPFGFIRKKLKALYIPWLAGVIFLNLFLILIIRIARSEDSDWFSLIVSYFLQFISFPLNPIQDRTLNPYFFSHYHLWYLSLLFYFFISYTLFRIIRSNLRKISYSENRQITNTILHISSVVVLSATGYSLMYFFVRDSWFVVSILQFQISRIMPYICFFILGISAHKNGWLTDFTFRFPELLLAVTVLLTPVLLFFTDYLLGSHSFAGIILYGFCRYILCLLMLISFLFTLKKNFNKVTSFNHIINRSSFGLYIVHLDVVAFFLFIFQRYGLFNNPVGEMIIIMILSTTIGIALYFGYLRIKHLIPAFND